MEWYDAGTNDLCDMHTCTYIFTYMVYISARCIHIYIYATCVYRFVSIHIYMCMHPGCSICKVDSGKQGARPLQAIDTLPSIAVDACPVGLQETLTNAPV